MRYQLLYKPFGENAILIEWPEAIEKSILDDLLSFKSAIQTKNSSRIVEIRSAYNSLLIVYKEALFSFKEEVLELKAIYNNLVSNEKSESRLWKIPVCYNNDFGLDLEALSKSKNMTKASIIKRHSEVIYTVYFIGFLPGFLYLGGLDEMLITPRKASPRLKVEKGSVAIGGNQTGVYPNESPGGWHIIGNSPIDFFNPKKQTPCFARAGDQIQFYQVDLKTYKKIKVLAEADVYELESEVIHD